MVTGAWFLVMVAFATSDGPPTARMTMYPDEEDCRTDLKEAMNQAFAQLGGHVDFSANCIYIKRAAAL